jgi:tetratricopeptide (TPR) repeat protein
MNLLLMCLVVFGMVTFPILGRAETITLKNGNHVEGKIIQKDADGARVDIGGGTIITYTAEELRPDPNDLSQGKADLPSVFTEEDLTPEQRKNYQENYVPIGAINADLSSGKVQERPLTAEELSKTAEKLYLKGDLQTAVEKLNEAIAQDASYLPAYRILADIYNENGSPDKSISLYDVILQKKPDWQEVYMNRGYAYGRLGQFEKAIEDYNEALRMKPDDLYALSARAAAYGRLEKWDLARVDYQKMADLNNEQGFYGLGNIEAHYKRWDEALKYYEKAEEISPRFAPVYLMKAQVYLQQQKKSDAVSELKKAKALGLEIPPELLPLLNENGG